VLKQPARPKLVSNQVLTFHSQWLKHLVDQYFELVTYDPDYHYSAEDCYYTNYNYATRVLDSTALEWQQRGGRVVVDSLWEIPPAMPGCYVLSHPDWFWFQESLWYQSLGYDQYQPCPAPRYQALMPMRLKKPHRDHMLKLLGTSVDQFIWSYQSQGRSLPNDTDPADPNNQRYFNPDWYDQSEYSVVLESFVTAPQMFITEKTFKPIAFQHPFLIVGCAGTLKYLQSLGFETWSNIWDESYDNISNWLQRSQAVVAEISREYSGRSKLTMDKLAHNRAHFYNRALVEQQISSAVLEPLLHYATTV